MNPYILMSKQISFSQRWEKLLDRIKSLSPDALEEFDETLTKMYKLYKNSGVRLIQKYTKTPDEYLPKLKELHKTLCSRVDKRFSALHSQTMDIIRQPEEMTEIFKEKERFKEAVENYKLLLAFHHRWKKHSEDHKDRYAELVNLRDTIARKHTALMIEIKRKKEIDSYRQRLEILEKLDEEVDHLHSWYCKEYLNIDGNNENWWSNDEDHVCVELPEGVTWMPVRFKNADGYMAPLEHLRKLPTDKDIHNMNKIFSKFLQVYVKHGLITHVEKHRIMYYDTFNELSEKHSIFSDDSEERLKAALLQQVSTFHDLLNDAKSRHDFKINHEKMLDLSFASYFAPLDELYDVLSKGKIYSENSLAAKAAKLEKGIPLKLFPEIEDGDAGFIFPVTKVLSKHLFTQLNSKDGAEIHLFSRKNPEKPVEVDVRDGVFIAPKDKILKYRINGQEYSDTYESYFRKFFYHLAKNPPDWFDPSRTEGWLSRHCIFYTDDQRKQLLNLLENRVFVSIINRFTNRKIDNLAFYQTPGSLTPAKHHRIYEFTDPDTGEKRKHAVTLFEWLPKS